MVKRCVNIHHFNPRIPYGMRHPHAGRKGQSVSISIHASRMGCDRHFRCSRERYLYFNPRIPYGMRPGVSGVSCPLNGFQSTHPVWDATHRFRQFHCFRRISIHASRMGCDFSCLLQERSPFISIHASRMGCDGRASCRMSVGIEIYFNPRIPYGMRLREWTLHSIIWKLLPALRADYIADIPEHLSVCIFGL